MNTERYPAETLPADEDDGTMPASLEALGQKVIGHKIVSVEKATWPGKYYGNDHGHIITLDNGNRVRLSEEGDCCAYTEIESFLLNVDKIDHVITGVGTTDGFTKWHIYADMGDVLELTVGWSCGNPFYYGYGFEITVEPVTA